MGATFLPMVMVAREFLSMRFAMGSTIALRQSDLKQIGGFESVSEYLADDYPEKSGWGHSTAEYVVAAEDEALLEKYLEDHDLDPEEIRMVIRRGTVNRDFVPVLLGSAFKNKGVQQLLDAVVNFLPSPIEVQAIQGVDPNDPEKQMERPASDDEPFSALAFKIINDPFVGQLTFFRVYSGVLEAGSGVLNSTKGKKERIGRLLKMHANKREEIQVVRAGDIAAVPKLKETYTGDTLCAAKKAITVPSGAVFEDDDDGKRDVVYVKQGDGEPQKRKVAIGQKTDKTWEVVGQVSNIPFLLTVKLALHLIDKRIEVIFNISLIPA